MCYICSMKQEQEINGGLLLMGYLAKRCPSVIGRVNTKIFISTLMMGKPTEKGLLFLTRTLNQLRGKLDDEVIDLLEKYIMS